MESEDNRSKDDDSYKTDDRETASVAESLQYEAPNGGWGWMVVAASLTFNIIYDGCSYSFGILFTDLLDYFGDTKSRTAWIGSLFFSVPLLCGPLAGLISSRYGFRKSTMVGGAIAMFGFILGAFSNSTWQLCLSYGLIAGFGMSLPYFNSIAVVTNYFTSKRALATGIAECGAGFGTVLFAPFTEFLISKYGWRGGVLILGGITGNIIVCGCIFRPLPLKKRAANIDYKNTTTPLLLDNLNSSEENVSNGDCTYSEIATKEENHIKKQRNEKQLKMKCSDLPKFLKKTQKFFIHYTSSLRVVGFTAFAFSNFVMYFWYDVPYVFAVDRAKFLGISNWNSALLITIIGIMHFFAILAYGSLGDWHRINRPLLYGVSVCLCGVSVGLVPLAFEFIPLAVLSALFGCFSAAVEAMLPVIIVDCVGLEGFNHAFGIVMFLEGVANLIGPPIAGWLCDVSGSYDATFYSAGSCVAVAGLVFAIIPLIEKKPAAKRHTEIELGV